MLNSVTKHIFVVIMYFMFGIILLFALTNDTTKGLMRDSMDRSFDEQFREQTMNGGLDLTQTVEQAFDKAVEIRQ